MPTATPIRFNANAVIEDAFLDLGVFEAGNPIPAPDAQFALRLLNKCVNTLSLQPLTFPFIDREVFDVVTNQSTYTIGPGGDFDTIKPMALTGAGLLLPSQSASTGAVEIPRAVLTDDGYQAIQVKDLRSTLWTSVYYNPTFADGLGSVFLWPTPTSTTYQCVLYRGDVIQGFADLTTFYDFPPGYAELLQYQLEKRLAKPYGQPWEAADDDKARTALALVKRQNFKLADTPLDPALTRDRRSGYNIQTGTGG